MLFFRSEEDVAEWKRERNVSGGEILPLAQLWELSKIWYGNRLLHEFHGRSLQAAQDIFRQVGLTSRFWYTE
jgi:hypothetical protein